jgi:Pentapeptide repeats (8 copies)
MADPEQLRILKEQGVDAWNEWRRQVKQTCIGLSEADLEMALSMLNEASGADLSADDLRAAELSRADLSGADLRGAHLGGADLRRADLSGANLNGAILSDADLTGCRIFGVSAWRLTINEGTQQRNLVITDHGEPEITADDIEVAQFLYLLIHNEKLRKVIDTITSKVVLILGRFSEERKPVLDAVRDALRKRDLLPVIFDFAIPASRDVTESVKVLAGLARFVIADITDATEVRAELHSIVPAFPSLAIQPILLRGQPEFVSMSHLQAYPSFLPLFEYDTIEHLLANLESRVVAPAEAKVRGLQSRGRDSRV